MTAFSSPFLLGFEQMEQMFDRVSRTAGDAYPPYNVERIAGEGGSDELLITLAVAGFGADELSVEVEGSTLTIRGARAEEAERIYLHRGIANRRFERSFVLAEGIEVSRARLENGLLAISLTRRLPERTVRQVPITAGA